MKCWAPYQVYLWFIETSEISQLNCATWIPRKRLWLNLLSTNPFTKVLTFSLQISSSAEKDLFNIGPIAQLVYNIHDMIWLDSCTTVLIKMVKDLFILPHHLHFACPNLKLPEVPFFTHFVNNIAIHFTLIAFVIISNLRHFTFIKTK